MGIFQKLFKAGYLKNTSFQGWACESAIDPFSLWKRDLAFRTEGCANAATKHDYERGGNGTIFPLLCNLYLTPLDEFIEKLKKKV